jgi:exopolyphosphatase/guanosine-5'-triphosphate,3'-diphosphate pyrophosphatase
VRALLAAFPERDKLCAATATGRMHLLGTSGTVTTLAGVHLGLARYDRRRVDGTWMSADEVSAMMQRIIAMDFDARVASPCIGAERADLVLAGCAILEAIRREWPCGRLRVADRGLREGILVELMSADRVWERARRRYRRQGQANGNGHA